MTDPDRADIEDTLALDYVLGILREPDLSRARLAERDDAIFAALVAAHRTRLFSAADFDTPVDVTPPPASTWEAISARIDPDPKKRC